MNYKSVGKRRSSALIDLCFSPKRMRIFSINQSFPPRFRLATLDFIPLCLQLQCVPYTLHLECSAPYIPDNNMESYLNKACKEILPTIPPRLICLQKHLLCYLHTKIYRAKHSVQFEVKQGYKSTAYLFSTDGFSADSTRTNQKGLEMWEKKSHI